MSLGQVVFGAKVTAPAARGSQTSQEVKIYSRKLRLLAE